MTRDAKWDWKRPDTTFALGDLSSGGTSLFSGTISGFTTGDSLDAGRFGIGTSFVYVPGEPSEPHGRLEGACDVGANATLARRGISNG